MLLEMVAEGDPDRVVVGPHHGGTTAATLLDKAKRAAVSITKHGAKTVGYFGLNDDVLPVALFGAALAGVPFSPINYRAPDEQLTGILARVEGGLMIADPDEVDRLAFEAQMSCIASGDAVAHAWFRQPGTIVWSH